MTAKRKTTVILLGELALLVACAGSLFAQGGPPLVTKIEPPSWWAGHSINPVRLLLHGKNLVGARVRATNIATRPSDVLVNRAGTYLFVSVQIARSARPGNYPLVVDTPHGSVTVPFVIEQPLDAHNHFQGITTDDVIYLIMIDRFADG